MYYAQTHANEKSIISQQLTVHPRQFWDWNLKDWKWVEANQKEVEYSFPSYHSFLYTCDIFLSINVPRGYVTDKDEHCTTVGNIENLHIWHCSLSCTGVCTGIYAICISLHSAWLAYYYGTSTCIYHSLARMCHFQNIAARGKTSRCNSQR